MFTKIKIKKRKVIFLKKYKIFFRFCINFACFKINYDFSQQKCVILKTWNAHIC